MCFNQRLQNAFFSLVKKKNFKRHEEQFRKIKTAAGAEPKPSTKLEPKKLPSATFASYPNYNPCPSHVLTSIKLLGAWLLGSCYPKILR